MIRNRASLIRSHLNGQHRQADHGTNPSRYLSACLKTLGNKIPVRGLLVVAAEAIQNKFLTTQRKTLEQMVPNRFVRWLLRRVFSYYGFACRSHVCNNEDGRHHNGATVNCPRCDTPVVVLCDGTCYASIEYRGIFDLEPDARWAANCKGGSLLEVPYNAALPEETVSYGKMEVPMSEAAQAYRKGVPLPFVAVPRSELERLNQKVKRTDGFVEENREWLQ